MDKKQLEESAVIYTSDRNIMLDRAEGVYMWDANGKRYLDFAGAIAVNAFGNVNKEVVKALTEQMQKLGQTSMSHNTQALETTSRLLVNQFDPDGKVFWSNTGAEANEAALKGIYFYQHSKGRKERDTVISFDGAFHGRTMRTLAATGKYMEGFGPVPAGFKRIPYNDINALKAAIDNTIAGIIVEPVQGEGGIIVPSQEFISSLRQIANEHDLVLSFDEVQVGMGRTGKLFAYENFGVKPDIITLAKALSGGTFPVAATLFSGKIANEITANNTRKFQNGTTFGGNPLALTAAGKSLELLLKDDNEFMGRKAQENAAYLKAELAKLANENIGIEEARGIGFILGIKLVKELNNLSVVETLRSAGLFTMPAGENVIRLVPPLNVKKNEIDEAVGIIRQVMKNLTSK